MSTGDMPSLISSSSIFRSLLRGLAKPAAWRAQLIPRSKLRGALLLRLSFTAVRVAPHENIRRNTLRYSIALQKLSAQAGGLEAGSRVGQNIEWRFRIASQILFGGCAKIAA